MAGHGTVVRDNPKETCPICHMPLSKRKKGAAQEERLPPGIVNRVQLSPYRVVQAGVQTWTVDYVPLTKKITTVGYVEFNEREQRQVAARVKGRLDKLFVNETGPMVEQDEDLASLYSPDLVSRCRTCSMRKRSGNAQVLRIARERLQLWGISDDQIDEILRTGQANTHLKIRSPIRGHVIKKYVQGGPVRRRGHAAVRRGRPFHGLDRKPGVRRGRAVSAVARAVSQRPPRQEERAAGDGNHGVRAERAVPRHAGLRLSARRPGHAHRHGPLRAGESRSQAAARFDGDRRAVASRRTRCRCWPRPLSRKAADVRAEPQARAGLGPGRAAKAPSSTPATSRSSIARRPPASTRGSRLTLGPRMVDRRGSRRSSRCCEGCEPGDKVVTAGSFLVDAETRLNPAAGSIYFGGTRLEQAGTILGLDSPSFDAGDEDTAVKASLAKLSPADRAIAEAQGFCPINQTSRLGSMGRAGQGDAQRQARVPLLQEL